MLIKKGSKGAAVKELQKALGITADGIFGAHTEEVLKAFQEKEGLAPDGLAGPATFAALGLLDTDLSTKSDPPLTDSLYSRVPYKATETLEVVEYFMPKDEYLQGPINPEWLFLHHTAGWHNPFNTVKAWDADKIGRIATEFVLGGPSCKGNDNTYDGVLVQCFPKGNWAYHLGKNGSQTMHKNSVGIEVCNFGYVTNGKTYAGAVVDESQIVELAQPFRGHKLWHRYSDKQIQVLKEWILWIAERDGIDVRAGLPALIKKHGAAAFEFNEDAYYGRVKGLWTHTNTRKDKVDMFPQQELMDMLMSL